MPNIFARQMERDGAVGIHHRGAGIHSHSRRSLQLLRRGRSGRRTNRSRGCRRDIRTQGETLNERYESSGPCRCRRLFCRRSSSQAGASGDAEQSRCSCRGPGRRDPRLEADDHRSRLASSLASSSPLARASSLSQVRSQQSSGPACGSVFVQGMGFIARKTRVMPPLARCANAFEMQRVYSGRIQLAPASVAIGTRHENGKDMKVAKARHHENSCLTPPVSGRSCA